jgi:hypothetical protein
MSEDRKTEDRGQVCHEFHETISTSEPAIDQPAVDSFQHAFLARPEREVAADFHTGWNQFT